MNDFCNSLTISMYTCDKEFTLVTYASHYHIFCHDNMRSCKCATSDDNGQTVNKQIKEGLSEKQTCQEESESY